VVPDGEAQDGGQGKVDPGEASKLSDRPIYEKLELEPKGSTASVLSALSASGRPGYPRRGSTNAALRKASAPSALRKLSAPAYGGRRRTVSQNRSQVDEAGDDDDDLSSQIPGQSVGPRSIRAQLRRWDASQRESSHRGSEDGDYD